MNNLLIRFFLLLLFSASTHAQNNDDDNAHGDYLAQEQHGPAYQKEEHDHAAHEDTHDEEDHSEEHTNSANHEDHDHVERAHQEGMTEISADMANHVGIQTTRATNETLRQTIRLYGSIVAGSEQISHVRARYEGLIQSVSVSIGDQVEAGDLLAEVESNDSLNTYQIRAPISGKITQRHANTGEFTQDQILFSIMNFDSLWAELHVFSVHQSDIKPGLSVDFIGIEAQEAATFTIAHIVPALDRPNQIARVKVDNTVLGLFPGQMLETEVEIGSFNTPLAVELKAVQSLEGREGVFVRDGEKYIFTPLILGRRDDTYVEVLEGLEFMTEYVTENSYLIKADIEKSEAEHEH